MTALLMASFGLVALFGVGMWIGYRMGRAAGLNTWRKSYLYMTADDVAAHKAIINQMANR